MVRVSERVRIGVRQRIVVGARVGVGLVARVWVWVCVGVCIRRIGCGGRYRSMGSTKFAGILTLLTSGIATSIS